MTASNAVPSPAPAGLATGDRARWGHLAGQVGMILLTRLVRLVAVLFAMSILAFSLIHLVPGDPARVAAGPGARPQEVAQLRHQYGLDRPVVSQYLYFLGRLVHGDLGQSLRTHRAVTADLSTYAPVTVELILFATVLMIVGGFTLGTILAAAPGRGPALIANWISLAGVSIPPFLFALAFQLLSTYWLKWLPTVGLLSQNVNPPPHITGMYPVDAALTGHVSALGDSLLHLLLPALALALGPMAAQARMLRSTLRDALEEEYAHTARAHGLPESRVVLRHALRNALLPPISLLGLQIGSLISWAMIVEIIFGLPGLGSYLLDSVASKDLQPILATTLVIGIAFVVVNMLVDAFYRLADPRVRA